MTPSPSKQTGRKQKRLFQSKTLTAIFGTSVANMVTRIVIVLAAIGTIAIITTGILHPNTPSSSYTTASSNANTHTSQAPVGLQVGDAAPNFTLSTPHGNKVSLSDYRGKPVLLNFWYSTCPGCLAEIPGMQRYYAGQQASGKAFAILGVNVVDDAATTTQFVHQEGITYPVVVDERQQVETLYNVNGTPMSFFIDRQGIIRSIVNGPVDETTLQQDVAQISS